MKRHHLFIFVKLFRVSQHCIRLMRIRLVTVTDCPALLLWYSGPAAAAAAAAEKRRKTNHEMPVVIDDDDETVDDVAAGKC
jgi:hypothetical protein